MIVGMIGVGVVGGTTYEWLRNNNPNLEIRVYDPGKGFEDDISACDAYIISVPVPIKGFMQDLSAIEDSLLKCNRYSTIFIRSTLTPGTADALAIKHDKKISHMPEFLTARRAYADMDKNPVYFGYPETFPADEQIYRHANALFGHKKDTHYMKNKECEMAKLMHNCFGAMKVTYFNAIHHLCEKNDIDFEKAKEVIFHTGYINEEHTMVPGPDGRKGYGGTCFPVNIEAMIGFAGSDLTHNLFKDIYVLNKFFRNHS